jgi:hypothetical protein
MAELDEDFDDPQLKGAIRGAMGRPSAPPALRARIAAALDAEDAAAPAGAKRVRNWRLYRYAAVAAVLLIGLSLGYVWYFRTPQPAAPDWFIDAMVSLNDDPAQVNDPQIAPPGADLKAVRETLSQKLKHPVLAASPGEGWQFTGATVAEIRGTPAAHLMFKRGDDTLSVYSISAERMYMGGSPNGARYQLTKDGHPIAGFVYKGAVHCVVESSKNNPPKLADAVTIRDRLRNALAMK